MLVRPADFRPAVNYDKGRGGTYVDHIVIYCTRTTGIQTTVQICQSPLTKRSYHFVVGRDGEVFQTVHITDTAWHASNVSLPLANERSIGIALVGVGNVFTSRQYSSLYKIIVLLIKILGIEEEGILGYEDIYLSDIVCPGPNFSWKTLLDKLFPFSNHSCSPVKLNRASSRISIPRGLLNKNIYGIGKV